MTLAEAQRIVRREYPRAYLVVDEQKKRYVILTDLTRPADRFASNLSPTATWLSAARSVLKGEFF